MIREIAQHRSVRQFLDKPVPEAVLDEVLAAATRASNTGNMQLYSMVVTSSPQLLQELAPLHFNQPCAQQAPVQVTVCADINRFHKWCLQRGAKPEYDNFLWFTSAVIDASLAAENMALEAEAQGLGVVFLGTAIYNASKIAALLKMPWGVLPVTTLLIGYAAEQPPLTERLPVEGVVHRETYNDYAPDDIDRIWAEREASPLTRELLAQNNLPTLARIFTERRYRGEDNVKISQEYLEFARKQGFFNQ